MVSTALLEEILNNVERMQGIPSVALQVSQLLDNPDTDAQEMAQIIVLDPSLTAQVLKICNSAEYGFSRKIATISEAVSILGYKALKNIIFTIISHEFLNRPVEGYALGQGELWENAVTCGAYAKAIAQKVGYKDLELVFVAALLRDVGKIALENYLQGKRDDLQDLAINHKRSFVEAEEEMIGASHTEVGLQLAARWNLPESLTKVIAHHHQPSALPAEASVEDKKLVSIVHLADCYTMMSGTGLGIDGLMYPLDQAVFSYLGWPGNQSELEVLFAELLDLRERIDEFAASL